MSDPARVHSPLDELTLRLEFCDNKAHSIQCTVTSDQSALNKFLTQAEWDEDELNRRRIQLVLDRLHRRPVSSRAGRLIIDDTLVHHTTCRIEELAYLKDHTVNRYVWAHHSR